MAGWACASVVGDDALRSIYSASFHDNLTTIKVDEILQTYRNGQGKDVK